MAIEIVSRSLAVLAAVAFTWVLATGRLPVVPQGRWTVAALFALGLGMCTIAGTRDGIGISSTQPDWLTGVFAALGITAFGVLLGVVFGLNWRLAVAALAVVVAASWLLALGYAIYAGLGTAPSGVITLVVAAIASLAIWRLPRSLPTPISHAQ